MKQSSAKILLVFVFAARGTSFLFSKNLLATMSPSSVLAVRFLLSFLILSLIFFRRMLKVDKAALLGGVKLGALYTLCMLCEMYGLKTIDTGVSSLVENMAIIFVPIFAAAIARTLPKAKTIFCALLALCGVALLSLTQIKKESGGFGMFLIVAAAVTYAFCILATEKYSKDCDPVAVGIIQLGTMGLLSLLFSLAVQSFALPPGRSEWFWLLLLVLLCSCFGFTFQPVGQKYVSAESAAVLTAVNPLTAAIMGFVAAGEEISLKKLAGCAIILAALLLYNIKAPQETRQIRSIASPRERAVKCDSYSKTEPAP